MADNTPVPPDDTGLSGPIPQITLPDVLVTPDEPQLPPTAADALTVGGGAALNGMMTARLAGYQWPEIDSHLAQARDTAAQAGYTDQEVDQHLGYQDPGVLASRIGSHVQQAFQTSEPSADHPVSTATDGVVEPTNNPERPFNVGPLTPNLRADYAASLTDGAAKGPQDFSSQLAASVEDTTGHNIDPASPAVAAQLPTPQAAVDYGIGIAQAAGLPSVQAATDARTNVLSAWAKTGAPLPEIYQASHTDPLFQDALTSAPQPEIKEPPEPRPAMPTAPTLEDLEKPNRDAINKVYFLPGEELPDEHSLIGALKDAGSDALMYTGGEIAGRYIVAPIARKVMEMAAPTLAKMGEAIKGTLSDMSGQLGGEKPPGIGHNMPPEAIEDINTAANRIDNARLVRPPELPVPVGIDYTAKRGGFSNLEDELNRLRTNDTADKIELLKVVDALPAEWRKDSFQEKVSASVEQRMVSGDHEHEPEVQGFLDAVKGLTSKQHELGKSIDGLLHGDAEKYDPSLRIKPVDEGYMHRIRQDQEIPESAQGEQENIISGYGQPHTLSGYASGMQARESHYVFEHDNGTRVWGQQELDRTPYEMGQKLETPDGRTVTVRPATMAEIEANTPIKYNKNFLLNTVENVARLGRVERNLRFMDTAGKTLEKQGLFVRETPGKFQMTPPGMMPIDIPQMKGWAIPKIAHPLNDFYQEYPQGDFLNALRSGNRMLLNTMFLNPLVHTGNMGFQWMYSRGTDWITGWGSLYRHLADATQEVSNMGPRYVEHLREGAALQYGSTQVGNFWQIVQNKMIRDMVDTPELSEYAKFMDTNVADIYRGMLQWSKAHMWNWGDRLALARQFELQEKGMSTREAIFQAEKDINNYRVSSTVLGSHALHQALVDPLFSTFGRYRAGLIRSQILMVRDMMKGAQIGSYNERVEAIAKGFLIAGMIGAGAAVNYGLSQLPGNFQLGSFGVGSMYEQVSRLRNLAHDQAAWISALGSIAQVSPIIQLATQLSSNHDVLGRQIINWSGSKAGIAGEAIEEALKQIMPGQVALDAMKAPNAGEAVARILGSLVKLRAHPPVDPKQQTKWEKADTAKALSQENKDSFVNWFKNNFTAPSVQQHQPHSSYHNEPRSSSPYQFNEPRAPRSAPSPYQFNSPAPRRRER